MRVFVPSLRASKHVKRRSWRGSYITRKTAHYWCVFFPCYWPKWFTLRVYCGPHPATQQSLRVNHFEEGRFSAPATALALAEKEKSVETLRDVGGRRAKKAEENFVPRRICTRAYVEGILTLRPPPTTTTNLAIVTFCSSYQFTPSLRYGTYSLKVRILQRTLRKMIRRRRIDFSRR